VKLPEFLKRIQESLGLDPFEARRSATSILGALFARLTPDEARHLAAQLPHQLRDRYVVKRGFDRLSAGGLVRRVADDLDLDEDEAIRRIQRVFRVVREAVSPGAVEHALDQMPQDLQSLLT
jgi:uncharacterized protein (DUF2267 family)